MENNEDLKQRLEDLEKELRELREDDSKFKFKIMDEENPSSLVYPIKSKVFLSKAYHDTFRLPDLMIEIGGERWVIFRKLPKPREWKAVCYIDDKEDYKP